MIRRGISIAIMIFGFGLTAWGLAHWFGEGMPTNHLFPDKNHFGSNVIHAAYIGIMVLGYGFFDYCNQNNDKE